MIPIKTIAGTTVRYVRTPQEQVEFDRLRAILTLTLGLDWKGMPGEPDGREVANDCAETLWSAGFRCEPVDHDHPSVCGGGPDFDAVLRLHEPDVTSWDAGDLHGCLCDNWDGRDWDEHRAHVVQALSEAMSSWLKSGGAA